MLATRRRRQRLVRMLRGAMALLPAAPVRYYSRDIEHRYRPESSFFYLSGFDEPAAAILLTPRHSQGLFRLLVRPRDPQKERWEGPRAGIEAAVHQYGADRSHPIGDLENVLERLLPRYRRIYLLSGIDPAVDRLVSRVITRLRRVRPRRPRVKIRELAPILAEMRLVKDGTEIQRLKRAARITCRAHRAALRGVAPGRFEYEIQAILEHEFRLCGAAGPAYPSIVASGSRACYLHYTRNDARMRSGELLLLDAGCENDLYSADVTRTVPVNGRFSTPQRQLYDLVLAAQTAAIGSIGPGVAFDRPHKAAVHVLSAGLVALGLLPGTARQQMEKGGYRTYFMHRTSHWLGMDVHDVGEMSPSGRFRRLAAGMVLTVEPGLYIPPTCRDVPARYRGIGIRIEDDILVTVAGHENLTRFVPKDPVRIQKMICAAGR
ncbi:MAG: aminopeptidase P N-terminal domain-containing protein [Acidobacteriota bacterium]